MTTQTDARNSIQFLLKNDGVSRETKNRIILEQTTFVPTDPGVLALQTTILDPRASETDREQAIKDLVALTRS